MRSTPHNLMCCQELYYFVYAIDLLYSFIKSDKLFGPLHGNCLLISVPVDPSLSFCGTLLLAYYFTDEESLA
jgi:hypothetical protein